MKKYEYVSIISDKLIGSKFVEHRKIIDKYALKGYSYIGFIPVHSNSDGKLKEVDLIFEIVGEAELPLQS